MDKKSLGLIETVGLTAAIEAADTAVKAANVELVGYELTRGGGMVVVKVEGDVGAVNAAIMAAQIAASKINRIVSVKVIARPATDIERLVHNQDTVGVPVPPQKPEHPEPAVAKDKTTRSGGRKAAKGESGTAQSETKSVTTKKTELEAAEKEQISDSPVKE